MAIIVFAPRTQKFQTWQLGDIGQRIRQSSNKQKYTVIVTLTWSPYRNSTTNGQSNARSSSVPSSGPRRPHEIGSAPTLCRSKCESTNAFGCKQTNALIVLTHMLLWSVLQTSRRSRRIMISRLLAGLLLVWLGVVDFNSCDAVKSRRRSPRRLKGGGADDDDGPPDDLIFGCKGVLSPKGGPPSLDRYEDCSREVRQFLEVQTFFCFGTNIMAQMQCSACIGIQLPFINKPSSPTTCSVYTSPTLCAAAENCFDECNGCEDIITEVFACRAAGNGGCDGALPCQCSS